MNRITQCFNQLQQNKKKALVTYIVCGDPNEVATLATMHAMVNAGANIIEVGVPFSDPMAEGPVIQQGHERALASGTSLRSALAVVKKFRQQDSATPIILMGYHNPVERMGANQFATAARDAGVDGVIAVDLPPEEAKDFNTELKHVGIENIFLLAPTTTETRAKHIISLAGGFLYYVSVKGITGAGHLQSQSVNEKLVQLKKLTKLPICVGFGIKDGESARAVTEHSEGAVVGSLLVNKMGELKDADVETIAKAVADLVAPIRQKLNE
jgi:tryptophan synthase alpha chain